MKSIVFKKLISLSLTKVSLNVLQKFMVIFCLSMFVVGCSNNKLDKPNSTTQHQTYNLSTDRITSADLEFIGVEHNLFLDEIHNEIIQNDIQEEEALEFIKSFAINNIENSPCVGECRDFAISLIENEKFLPHEKNGKLYSNEHANYLTTNMKIYLDNLRNIIYDAEDSLNLKLNRIVLLEETINNDLSLEEKDLVILYSATNVAKHSMSYWSNEQNIEKWGFAGKTDPWWQDVIAADVIGAIAGAIIGFAINLIPAFGQVGYGVIIFEMAGSASVSVALWKLYEWIFD